jgi:hypothetical protein
MLGSSRLAKPYRANIHVAGDQRQSHLDRTPRITLYARSPDRLDITKQVPDR